MKIVVLGAGAIGLTVAAKLSRVADVHAVARTRHAAAVRKRVFLMTGIWGEGAYRFSCSEDLSPGRRTKIDFMNGAVASLARKHGIDASCNACIAELIRFRERL